MQICKNCNSSTRPNKSFCSSVCHSKWKKKDKVRQWLEGSISGTKKGCRLITSVREYLLDQAGHKCSRCGWGEINKISGKPPLEINHKDGNSDNNRPENLEVICPNCHALTSSWKALNKGNGNKERLRYSKLIV